MPDTTDRFETNFEYFGTVDAEFKKLEDTIKVLENLRPLLHRDLVREQNEETIIQANVLLNELFIIRVYCDQNAGCEVK